MSRFVFDSIISSQQPRHRHRNLQGQMSENQAAGRSDVLLAISLISWLSIPKSGGRETLCVAFLSSSHVHGIYTVFGLYRANNLSW